MNQDPLQWSDKEFESWRYVQDEPADKVAGQIIRSPHHTQVYRALDKIQKNTDQVDINIFKEVNESETDEEHEKLVELLNEYFSDTRLLEFTDEQKAIIRKGSDFFDVHNSEATIALAVRSLLKQYAAFKATNVLVFTTLLIKFPHRRILETMQFVIDVMDPQAFEPDGFGIRSIQKLRLVHALIRARIKQGVYDVARFGPWKEEWGLPINQQDMIFATHTFSIEVIDGLKAAGEKITAEEIENYYLTWHYLGRALGVKDEINPTSYAKGKALQERIYKNQFVTETSNGPGLSKPLIEFMHKVLPFQPRVEHIYAMIKLYNDEKDYKSIFEDILNIPIHQAHQHFLHFMKEVDRVSHWFIFLRYLFTPKHKKQAIHDALSMKNHRMLQALVSLEDTWSGKHFRIADGFGDAASSQDAAREKNMPSLLVRLLHKLFFRGKPQTA